MYLRKPTNISTRLQMAHIKPKPLIRTRVKLFSEKDSGHKRETSLAVSISHWLTRSLLVAALLVMLVTPFLAISWSKRPFPGFVVEQTLVISNLGGEEWSGRKFGLNYPQRVSAIQGNPVSTLADFNQAISELHVGSFASIRTISPDDTSNLYILIDISRFPTADLVRLFWLPYAIGLVYLVLGIWVYRLRGSTQEGRTFADLSACAAIVTGLTFDLSTTHLGSAVWTFCLAQLGSLLIGLALLFPQEVFPVARRVWVHVGLFLVSLILAMWGMVVLYSASVPWAYVVPWQVSYIYTTLGIVIFIGMLIYRVLTLPPGIARQQARIILWGSAVAFAPLTIWFIIPQVFKITMPWNPVIYLPLLIFFPLSIGVAILRYHLWDIDLIIRRTLLYTVLTLILAFLFWMAILIFGLLLQNYTYLNQIAVLLSIVVLVTLANPLRKRLQRIIDRRFYRQKYDSEKTLQEFSASLQAEVNLDAIYADLHQVVEKTIQPEEALLWVIKTKTGSYRSTS